MKIKVKTFLKVGLVKASRNFDRLSLHSLKNLLKDHKINMNIEIELDPLMTADEIIASGKLKLLRNKARSKFQSLSFLFFLVIVVEMGMDLHSVRNFLIATARSEMKTIDYVYVIPWLSHVG